MSEDRKVINLETVEKLETSKKAALKRVAKKLKSELGGSAVSAAHSSHGSSPAGRTHSSRVSG